MEYAEHFTIPPQRGRSDFVRCHHYLWTRKKVSGMAKQKVRYPRRGGVVQAEAYMEYAEHFTIPPQRGRSDFVRRHHYWGVP